ncbi:MAG: nitrogenase component 1 [Sphaerochaetaceae bacterium]|jgi:hypothetical protein|nr:nitrogenase component 1 [Sphaerochaetaceae bacterium]
MKAYKKLPIGDCDFASPFLDTLQYTPPARGMWNIVHVGMLIPESHQIFVCAGGCLRGVVLTAAEMGAQDRFSTVSIEEFETIDGSIEDNLIDGIDDVIRRLPKKPRAILVYTSCIHNFLNVDLKRVYAILRKKYPVLEFTDCYMTPTMRKSGIDPDEKMRMQLYSLIDKPSEEDDGVTFIGDVYPISRKSELYQMVKQSGRTFREITGTLKWEQYQELGRSRILVYSNPAARKGAQELAMRLKKELVYLPYSFNPDVILDNDNKLSELLGVPFEEPDWSSALYEASRFVQKKRITIDYTASARPLSLARLLSNHGFEVSSVYLEGFNGEEKDDFEYLKKNFPAIQIIKSSHPDLPFDRPNQVQDDVIAIGQKCAYYENTEHFVNLIADGGHYGFEAIDSLSRDIISAFNERKPVKDIITVKGWGCRI